MQETTVRGPGRTRDPDVIARDEIVYALIASGIDSRSKIAIRTGYDRDAVYLSCKRLQRAGRIRPCLGANGAPVWVVAGTRCP